MATIAILLDIEEGHFLKTFKLAKELRARGHRICFLGLEGAAAMVREQGFELVPVFDGLLAGAGRVAAARAAATDWFGPLVSGEALDGVIARLAPDLVIMLSLYYPEALAIHLRYRLPIVLMASFRHLDMPRAEVIENMIAARFMGLRSEVMAATLAVIAGAGVPFHSFKDLARVVIEMPELVQFPQAVELPELADEPGLFYVGGGVDLERREEPFPWNGMDRGRYLVYCSLGSQCDLKPELARRFIQAVLGAAAARPQRQFILSLGKGFAPSELAPAPANVHLSRWVPQLEVLRRADLMVTHGGRGTVLECLSLGVPMVVLPLMRDQFEMSRRIAYHRLGIEASLPELTAETLDALIGEAAADPSLRARVAAMRRHCAEADRSDLAVRVIEAAIAGGASREVG